MDDIEPFIFILPKQNYPAWLLAVVMCMSVCQKSVFY